MLSNGQREHFNDLGKWSNNAIDFGTLRPFNFGTLCHLNFSIKRRLNFGTALTMKKAYLCLPRPFFDLFVTYLLRVCFGGWRTSNLTV